MKRLLLSISFLFSILISQAQDWTWVHGGNSINTYGFYGTQGVTSPTVIPGTRHGSATWIDASGNLWLFGGEGLAGSGSSGWLNDLWKFDQTLMQWTWIKGQNAVNLNGVFGTQGVPAPTNNPGGREFGTSWVDASGKFWLYGGDGYGATGGFGRLGDLWRYDPGTNEWTWISGPNSINQNGIYGTMGIMAPGNMPGNRYSCANWMDVSGNLWVFGGLGFGAGGGSGELNDIWKYDVGANQWTWIKGSTVINQNGIYGTMGTSAPSNNPGGRDFSITWKDGSGKVYLFGGNGCPATGTVGYLSDMWKYDPGTNEWTWMKGPNTKDNFGTYGTMGITSPSTNPGGRFTNMKWTDPMGNMWMFGGCGWASTGGLGYMNDMFKYNPVTNEWTWMKGANVVNQYGTYGTKSVTAPSNTPGARFYAPIWIQNNIAWMWGGFSFPVSGAPGNLNELWKFQFPCNPENTTAVTDQSICSGNSGTLSCITSAGTPNWYATPTSTTILNSGYSYTTPVYSTSTSTTYTFYAEVSTCTMSPLRTPITLTVNPLPIVTATSTPGCAGSTICIGANGASTYTWAGPCSFTTTNPTFCFPFSLACTCGFSVTGVDMNGCKGNSATMCLTISPTPTINAMTSSSLICSGQTATLTGSGSANSYTWSTGATGTVTAVSPTTTSTYTLTGEDTSTGCTASVSLTQNVSACTSLSELLSAAAERERKLYPNPNNGKFNVLNREDDAEVHIYNILGSEVFKYELNLGINSVDIGSLSNGSYLYKINSGNRTIETGKLMKQ